MFTLLFLLQHNLQSWREEGRGRGGGEERRGSGFSAALYPNPGFGNGMRRTQVRTNTSNNSTDMGLVGVGGGSSLIGNRGASYVQRGVVVYKYLQ